MVRLSNSPIKKLHLTSDALWWDPHQKMTLLNFVLLLFNQAEGKPKKLFHRMWRSKVAPCHRFGGKIMFKNYDVNFQVSHMKGKKHQRMAHRGSGLGRQVLDRKRLIGRLVCQRQAIVGLKSVREIISRSDEMAPPHYECSMCGKHGRVSTMMAHIFSRGHRENFLKVSWSTILGLSTVPIAL